MSIADAIRTRKLLQFSYDGYPRTVEPHTYGIDVEGAPGTAGISGAWRE